MALHQGHQNGVSWPTLSSSTGLTPASSHRRLSPARGSPRGGLTGP
jgi:hypothetical protein